MQAAWSGFKAGRWMHEIDVRDFIQKNYSPYDGDSGFLTGPGEKTSLLWRKCQDLLQKERESQGVLLVDADTILTENWRRLSDYKRIKP